MKTYKQLYEEALVEIGRLAAACYDLKQERDYLRTGCPSPAPDGWIGVDLDGTLAEYNTGDGVETIGKPIVPMMERVKNWLACGCTVKIMTARADREEQQKIVKAWLEEHGIGGLEVVNRKNFEMVQLWDDRVVVVEHNTGRILGGIA